MKRVAQDQVTKQKLNISYFSVFDKQVINIAYYIYLGNITRIMIKA